MTKPDESIDRLTYYGGTGIANIMVNNLDYARFMLGKKKEIRQSHAMLVGQINEPLVDHYFQEIMNVKTQECPRHDTGFLPDFKDFPVYCSLDAISGNCVIEYKTCFETTWNRVNEFGADDKHYWQLRAYMSKYKSDGYLVYMSLPAVYKVHYLPKDYRQYMLILKYKYDPDIENQMVKKLEGFTFHLKEARGTKFNQLINPNDGDDGERYPAENPKVLLDYIKSFN